MEEGIREQGTGNRTYRRDLRANHEPRGANHEHDIGAARGDEADGVLEVMCAAFELPFDVARPIFYADPYFDLDAKRVLRVNGRVVSCLTLSETLCRVGEAYVPITGIAGLATLPAFQKQGHAARLLNATVETLRERRTPLVGLYPFQSTYYERLGWETATQASGCVVAPADLPASLEAANVMGAEPQHIPPIAELYAQSLGLGCLSGARDTKRWQYLFDRAHDRWVYRQNDTVAGYLFCETQPGTIHIGSGYVDTLPTLRVLELCATTPEARRGLLAHLRARTAYGQILYVSTPQNLRDAGLLDLVLPRDRQPAISQIELSASLMLRVIDFPALLECLRPNWHGFAGTLALTLHDEQRPEASVTVVVKGIGDASPTLTILPPGVSHTAHASPTLPLPDNVTDHVWAEARQWVKVVVGHTGGMDACKRGLLRASTPHAVQLAAMLFPPRAPFLPALDHF